MPVEIQNFLRGLKDAGQKQIAAAVRGVNVFGQHVIGDAQELAPVLTGALKASGTTQPAELKTGMVTKEIGFNTNYAAAVHERLNVNHSNGQSKFLEAEMKEYTPKFGPFVSKQVKAAG
jgi:hypothetical protein